MLENDSKNMHGSFSIIGKISAEKYQVIMNKEKYLSGKEPKLKKNFLLSEEEEKEKINFRSKDEPDPFNLPPNYEQEKHKKLIFNQRKELCDPHYSNPLNKYEKWKYHQFHHKIESEKEHFVLLGPNCTKYSPKYDKIYPRSISGLKWNVETTKRRKIKKNKNNDDKNNDKNKKNNSKDNEEELYEEDEIEGDFYTKHGDLEPENIFIILKKQTMRPPNTIDHDTRIRRDKAFITESDLDNNILLDTELTTTGNTSITSTLPNKQTSLKKTKNKQNKQNKQNKFPLLKPSFNKKNSNNTSSFSNNNKSKSSNNTKNNSSNLLNSIKGPDFNKYISRATLDFISRDKEPIRPFFVPDYSYTIPRLINAVNYSQSLKKTSVQSRMKGLTENVVWDPDKVYYKVSKHKEPSALNFNLMVSRPNEGNLPSYMIRKFDRNSLYDFTDKSLKLNKFSDGKFMTDYSSFNIKKSFSDKINKDLMNSETLINSNLNDIVDYVKEDEKNRNIKKKINKTMEFYRKNFDKRNSTNLNYDNQNNFMWKSMDNKNYIKNNNNVANEEENNSNENKNKKIPNYNNRYEFKF